MAIDKLLSQPELEGDAADYYAVFLGLNGERGYTPSFATRPIPQRISSDLIRREGARLGYQGIELDYLVVGVKAIDEQYLVLEGEKILKESRDALKKKK